MKNHSHPTDPRFIAELTGDAIKAGITAHVTGGAIVIDSGILLVVRSSSGDEFAQLAELPGGGVEPGETLIQGLERELLEETGLKVDQVVAYLGHLDYATRSGVRKRQFNFLVKPKGTDIWLNPEEHYEHLIITSENQLHTPGLRVSPEVIALVHLSLGHCRDIKS